MSSSNTYRLGAIARCSDNASPKVTTSQWATVFKTDAAQQVEELYIFNEYWSTGLQAVPVGFY